MTAKLTHVSESKLEELRTNIARNLERYCGTGFADVTHDPGWAIELDDNIDLTILHELDGSDNRSESDLRNTKLVDRALGNLSPSLANEERIWVRLSHVEAFTYSRDRWLKSVPSDDAKVAAIETHFFARTQTRIRDDHAVSRLWWNAFVVKRCYPADFEKGLELLLSTADVRSNIVERIWLTGRRRLAAGMFRKMDTDPRVLASERSFREFMKALNFLGGGIVFEAMSDTEVDDFLSRCVNHAQNELEVAAEP